MATLSIAIWKHCWILTTAGDRENVKRTGCVVHAVVDEFWNCSLIYCFVLKCAITIRHSSGRLLFERHRLYLQRFWYKLYRNGSLNRKSMGLLFGFFWTYSESTAYYDAICFLEQECTLWRYQLWLFKSLQFYSLPLLHFEGIWKKHRVAHY